MNAQLHTSFSRDLDRNSYVSYLKKKRWVLLFLRLEQSYRSPILRRLASLGRKITLAGTGCEISAKALVGSGLRLPHLKGIVISHGARVGSDCTIFHQVTLGVNGRKSLEIGPMIGDRVSIGVGAKLIGPITVGNDVTIGANAVITKNIPDGATVVGFNHIINSNG